MRRRMTIILVVCGVGIPIIIFLCYWFNPWIILPVKSSSHTLTLVRDGYPRIHQITMRHYVNDVLINDYNLELKIGLRVQQPQKYMLPLLNEGRVEINVELVNISDVNIGSFTVSYDNANDMYKKGLMIYTFSDFMSRIYIGGYAYCDEYIYFMSGKERTYYFEEAGSSEWSLTTNVPPLKRFIREQLGYCPLPYNSWKENEWEVIPIHSNN